MILSKEPKPIQALAVDYNQRVSDWNPRVGSNGVTKIEAYDEPGQMAYVAWFRVWADDKVVKCINGFYVVEVFYES